MLEIEPIKWRLVSNHRIEIRFDCYDQSKLVVNKWVGSEQKYYIIKMYDPETYAWRPVEEWNSKWETVRFNSLEDAVAKIEQLEK